MKIPYVKFFIDEKKIIFYFNEVNKDDILQKMDDDGENFITNDGAINFLIKEENVTPKWANTKMVEQAIFDASFTDYMPTSTAYWFYNLSQLTKIINIENLNTSNVTNMFWMFANCSLLKNIDLSHFNTSKVKNMSYMFAHCHSLETIDLSSFSNEGIEWEDKPKEEDDNGYAAMFWDCPKLETIYIGNSWDENQKVLPMSGWLFADCPVLKGEKGSKPFDPEYDGIYARVDNGPEKPGYFTYKIK